MRLFAFLFLTLFALGQHSQPPSPTPGPSNRAHQSKSNEKNEKATGNDEATKQLTSAINQFRAEIASWNQQELAKQSEREATPDWWSRVSTILITLFTFALAVLAYLQWKVGDEQAKIGGKQADIAAEQLAITKAAEALHKDDRLAELLEGIRERRRSDERYTEQLELAKENAATGKQSADAAQVSAHVAQNALRLRELEQKQWVNVEDWRAFRLSATDPLEIFFNVVNPTSLPLTLHGVITKINGKPMDDEVPIGLLAPSNPFIHSVGLLLNEEQESLYTRDALGLDIECQVLFADAHGIHWCQEFGRRVLFGRGIKGIVTDTNNTLHESGVPGERGSRDVEFPK
jgi:hypothetical protein